MNVPINQNAEKSDITVGSRRHAEITGVVEVLSFDDGSVVMVTRQGELALEGEGLKIGTLDTERGIVSVDGKINAMIYYDDADRPEKKRLFGKLFKS